MALPKFDFRKSNLEEASEFPRLTWAFELSLRFGRALSNPLARHQKLLAHFFQRVISVHAESNARLPAGTIPTCQSDARSAAD